MAENHIAINFPEDITRELEGKRALVTGGTGMIGREIVRGVLGGLLGGGGRRR